MMGAAYDKNASIAFTAAGNNFNRAENINFGITDRAADTNVNRT